MGYLNDAAIAGLKAHTYSSSGYSPLDRYVMTPWWNFLVKLFPRWMAPNLITLIGLVITTSTNLLLVSYAPLMNHEAPRWAYATCALGLFIYQSLDAIDGKQARRTGTSSPLGELFDHGCDSITTSFVTLAAGVPFLFGPTIIIVVACTAYCVGFYCAHWMTYITGTLQFGTIDVTEGQLLLIAIYVLSTFYGPHIFQFEIFGLKCNEWFVIFALLGVIPVVFRLVMVMLNGKYSRTVANTNMLSPLLPLLSVCTFAFIPAIYSASDIISHLPAIYVIAIGCCFSKVTVKLVTASMSKSPMPQVDFILLGPFVLFMNGILVKNIFGPAPDFIAPYLCRTSEDESKLMWIILLFCAVDLSMFCIKLCREISSALNISTLTIPYTPKSE